MADNLEVSDGAGDTRISAATNIPLTLADAANFIKSGKSFDVAAATFAVAHGIPLPPSVVGRLRTGIERILDAGFSGGVRVIERWKERADFDAKLQRDLVAKAARKGLDEVPAGLTERIATSYLLEHQRKYSNKSLVVVEALKSLPNGEGAENEPSSAEISEDWLNYFADVASQKSSSEMQQLMGRILAGEVRRPGSFSPLTIHALATLTQNIAQKFERLCEAAIVMDGEVIVPALVTPDLEARGIPDLDISYVDMLHIRSYGLIASVSMSMYEFVPNKTSVIKYGGKEYAANLSAAVSTPVRIQGLLFSQVGRELHSLMTPPEASGFDRWFQKTFAAFGVTITPM